MNDENPSTEPERIRINADDLARHSAPSPAPRVVVDARSMPPAPPLENPATRRRDRRTFIIVGVLVSGVLFLAALVGGGILAARWLTAPPPQQGGISVRVPSDGEKRAIDKGDLALVAPSVRGRAGGLLGGEWGGSAIPWRMTASNELVLVTNAHVAKGPSSGVGALEVTFASGTTRPALAVGIADEDGCDLAVLVVDAAGLVDGRDFRLLSPQPAEEWRSLAAGDDVVAVGTPLGYPQTQTFGRISALRDSMPEFGSNGVRWVQVDATVLPGNSGGPLLRLVRNAAGSDQWRWVGVVTAKGVTGIGFAIHAGEVTARSFRWVLGSAPSFAAQSSSATGSSAGEGAPRARTMPNEESDGN